LEIPGFNFGYLLVMLLNYSLFIVWPVAAIYTIFKLRKADLHETACAIWAAVIVLIPILGVLAFLIVQPGRQITEQRDSSRP
jgi:hypothetical protein